MASRWRCMLCHAGKPDVVRSKRKRDLCDLCYDGLEARGLAWCSRCKRRKAQADMAPRRSWCRGCEQARNAAYAEASKPARAAWKERNRERILAEMHTPGYRAWKAAYNRAWRAANPERAKVSDKLRYQRTQDRRIAYARAWRAANREQSRANARRSYARRRLAILRSWRRAA